MYNDDEEPPPPKPGPARPMRQVQLTKHHSPEAPLAPNDQKVLLELKGVSSAAFRAPLDLVTVIDVSGSMKGEKLDNAKKALRFIISKLTEHDRLSIVQFDDNATRLCGCGLRSVTEAARADLENLVGSIQTPKGLTNIKDGLQTGLRVITDRKFTAGRAANIMLMSDGAQSEKYGDATVFDDPGNVPIHTFGFGAGHEPTVLEAIARKSLGGVYIFEPTNLSETFSKILAGLVTIIAQDLELTVTPIQGEATIKKVHAGTYPGSGTPSDGSSPVTVRFGTLYSEEVRRVTIELALSDRTALRPYRANVAEVHYRFTIQGQQAMFTSNPERIIIHRRKSAPDPADAPPQVQTLVDEVRRQQADSIKEAMKEADGHNLKEAQNILQLALNKLVEVKKKLVDPMLDMLQKELRKLLELFETEKIYREEGRPYAISSVVSHDLQRIGGVKDVGLYTTRRMRTYLKQAVDDKPPPSADYDVQEETEPEPGVLAGEKRPLSVALRLLTAVLSLLAFSIMASARTSGWAGDHYGRYEPYRYAVVVNVVVCFYSVAQAFIETRRLLLPRLRSTSCYCVTLFLDQVLAYLLISASSAAASQNRLWVSRFGKDRFDDKINVAVWFSFLAFLALSGDALISMANLFSRI
ncbi:uncharacterized protein LOC133887274 [Phragmites australis]|uniref:uncharacterized protein LOC133887274 n=1 Tax=Phragmites australis TaxID=29695 RepID=UPI002D76B421|nr:uncharacterized protein LOC133887274 [Phragmites australis]